MQQRPRQREDAEESAERVSELVKDAGADIDLHSSIGNATNSPLLQLPGEIRNMIFKYAVLSDDGWIALIFNRHNFISRSGPSTQACKDQTSSIAMRLPLVCRQIYSETATLFYSVNCFAFESDDMMLKWLAKRLLAQREAIRTLMLHSTIYERRVLDGEAKSMEPERKKIGD